MTKENIIQWFFKRGAEERTYQIDSIEDVLKKAMQAINSNSKEVVFAACPAAGKTVMSIVIKDLLFKEIKGSRAITLTHGQDILRTQYTASLSKYKPGFDWELVHSHHKINGCKDVVTLPHTIYKRDLSQFDNGKTFLIIDEGHQFFNAKMVQTIINKVKPIFILILTATPAPFVHKKTEMVVVPLNSLIKDEYVSNVAIEMAVSDDYQFGIGDMVGVIGERELKKGYDFKKDKTYKVLDKLLGKICERLKMDGDWKLISHEMCKSMYVCRNILQANYVKEYFQSKGINVALSDCVSDKDSYEIERFKNSKECTILIVVYKGIIGFDFAKMCNIIDLSGSSNVVRLFQLLCRLVRKEEDRHSKVFYKVIPKELKGYYRPIMNAVCYLQSEDGIRTFNGENLLDIPILVQNMVESDFKEDKIYENIKITKKHSVEDGFLYDVEILDIDGTVIEIKKKITYTSLLTELQVLPKDPKEGGPGRDKTTFKKWLSRKISQLPLEITSLDFFNEASKDHKMYGVYVETSTRLVYECLGISRVHISDEELFQRFKAVKDKFISK